MLFNPFAFPGDKASTPAIAADMPISSVDDSFAFPGDKALTPVLAADMPFCSFISLLFSIAFDRNLGVFGLYSLLC
jgi:hypothetical protein